MPDGPDFCSVRKSETCGVAPFLFVAPLPFAFVIEEFSMSRDKNGKFTDCGNPKGRPKALKYTPMLAESGRRDEARTVLDRASANRLDEWDGPEIAIVAQLRPNLN
jgi:hypothetical protein